MGRGLSELQRWMLTEAVTRPGHHLRHDEVFAGHYGWVTCWERDGQRLTLEEVRDLEPRPGQIFDPDVIGRSTYRTAQVSVSRAVVRLAARDLVIRWHGGFTLTEQGADQATADSSSDGRPSQPISCADAELTRRAEERAHVLAMTQAGMLTGLLSTEQIVDLLKQAEELDDTPPEEDTRPPECETHEYRPGTDKVIETDYGDGRGRGLGYRCANCDRHQEMTATEAKAVTWYEVYGGSDGLGVGVGKTHRYEDRG